jgi:hypothetical protein
MSKHISVTINGIEWTENNRRRDIACEGCGESTRGRIDKKPWCINCAMGQVMRQIKGLFSSFGGNTL